MTASLYVLPGLWTPGFAYNSTLYALQSLITSQHRGKPLYIAAIQALVADVVETLETMGSVSVIHDIDTATGAQLDEIGVWVGLSRMLPVPLTGVYFEWDSLASLGWDAGVFQGPFDPTEGLTELDDETYRLYLKVKIAANHWDGTLPGAYAALALAFTGTNKVILTDYQDMTMSMSFYGEPLGAVFVALMRSGYLPLKPAGVHIAFYGIPINDDKLFAWDSEGDELAGWDEGNFVQDLTPPNNPLAAFFNWDALSEEGWEGPFPFA